MLRLSDSLRRLAEPSAIFEMVTRMLAEHLGTRHAHYVHIDEARGLAIIAQDHTTSGAASIVGTYSLGDFPAAFDAMRGGRSFVVADVATEPLLSSEVRRRLLELSLRSFVDTPIIKEGKLVALLAIADTSPRDWTHHEMSLLEEVAERTWEALARARAEESLRRNEEFLSFALATARTGAWDLDLVDHTALRSLEHDRIFGYEQLLPEWTYEMFLEHVVPEDRENVDRLFQRAVETRGAWSFECRITRRDGALRWILAKGRHTRDASGRARRMAGIVQDITERKRAEAERAQTLQEVAEQRGRLQAAMDLDRRKDEFLAMLSHELRNPLFPIRNALYVLERASPESERARRAQTTLRHQVEHMTRIVDDLLDIDRVKRGSVVLHRARLELNELARRTVEDHRGAFEEAGIDLTFLGAPVEVWVSVDPTRLSQVIGNLLQNAVKVTPRGGKTSVVVEVDSARDHANVRVQDTGRGISPAMLTRIFEPFTQADTTIDRGRGGLGLGLAVVDGLVRMHGGAVRAESGGPGEGATFTIDLPLDTAVAAQRSAPPTYERPRPRRVLIIEDNAIAAEAFRDALELSGHEVDVAYDGAEGLEKARAMRPDVVVCDIGLPGMNGYDVARAIRSADELRHARLVALSGYAQPEDVTMAEEAGFDAHLKKPATPEVLERLIADAEAVARDRET